MRYRRFNDLFNKITYAAMIATVILVGLELLWWGISYFTMVN